LDEAVIDREKLDQFCQEKGFCGWFDTSAKLNINIDKAARHLVEEILKHQDIFEKKKQAQNAFQPGKPAATQQSGGCC
jgi:hypothetical protein